MSENIQERIGRNGKPVNIAGNVSQLLSGRGNAWWVESGTAEVFAFAQRPGGTTGRRIHKFTAGPGSLLIGIDVSEAGGSAGLIAVGLGECRLMQVSMAQLKKWTAESEELAGEVARLVDGWILSFSSGLEREVKPLTSCLLEHGKALSMKPGETQFTVTPRFATSFDRLCDRATMPALEAA